MQSLLPALGTATPPSTRHPRVDAGAEPHDATTVVDTGAAADDDGATAHPQPEPTGPPHTSHSSSRMTQTTGSLRPFDAGGSSTPSTSRKYPPTPPLRQRPRWLQHPRCHRRGDQPRRPTWPLSCHRDRRASRPRTRRSCHRCGPRHIHRHSRQPHATTDRDSRRPHATQPRSPTAPTATTADDTDASTDPSPDAPAPDDTDTKAPPASDTAPHPVTRMARPPTACATRLRHRGTAAWVEHRSARTPATPARRHAGWHTRTPRRPNKP